MDEFEKAIKRTKGYASKYGQKLSDKQLFLRLISTKIYDFSKIEGRGEKEALDKDWKEKLYLAKDLVNKHLFKMRGIKMVGVTGTVAAEGAKKSEDIDLLVITKEDELWWWRLYLRLYVWWNKIPHRKFKKREKHNEFCFNLWLDRANLTIPKHKRNLKNATDLILMKVVLDRDNTYQSFLKENKWVKKYLATGYEERNKRKATSKILGLRSKKGFSCWRIVNKVLFWGQYLYMWSKTRKKQKFIKRGQAFFHEDN
ncbi:MAG: hypothetical protein US68_C0003G0045 [Candidatus Shapirobacteria bacterium GW2011_GWE1_38_10]|uniref:Polymerase nucleotidyl transferase domain-containing protein n=1 Tax=Candidatus Shapirobacteria bacterium GW2011_GWE1_38_10 TaxID=1618488 RepID=A0A0G0KND3_9BACT|nr:MAG: hypothetical protein US46_C0008G0015 [Candidatus Shapirobacteria bacterium GW2011_GWF2_37_20]KKQ50679.1 MAG: hypothetical protein US68_C0003G0045 [Candidatus Shapirobacteria bacterium GW2011_GWE1_38_10]KKQ64390.1 MAG: hypothetical protein US85_C0010G0022 [Candidatus Shapirobacteria bacterium GW2011_GWF1_38_23]HBP51620.1 hypothetical protein [Candidatus Shapirobacteria bacterium]